MATLKEIANKGGVSVAAASVALSGRSKTTGISADTRKRVLRIAQKAGYRPNPFARFLRTGKTRIIGLCLPNAAAYLAHPQGARNFWTICRIAAEHRYNISIIVPGLAEIDPRTMDGCLVMAQLEARFQSQLTRLASEIPVLSMTASTDGAIPVHLDKSWTISRQRAAEYLYDLGHRRVAVTQLKPVASQGNIPSQFQKVARDRGIAVQIHAFAEAALDRRYPSTAEILKMKPLPTAVFAIDDDYARALISRLLFQRLRVPEDVSVFSGSTTAETDGMLPGLTGLMLHFEYALQELFREFVRILDGGPRPAKLHLRPFKVDLIERESCVPPRSN